MYFSNVWGQGQLFAFSALDGKTEKINDFVGTLSGDRLGIIFHTNIRRELAIVSLNTTKLTYDAVLSDYIQAYIDNGAITLMYANTHTILGELCMGAKATVFVEDDYQSEIHENITIHNTNDGQFTAISTRGNYFVFVYGNSKEEVIKRVENGFALCFEEVKRKKLYFYEKHQNNGPYAKLYNKCLSVMKSQLYTPECQFSKIWSTPNRLPHRHLWLWDSVFHAIGHRNIHPSIAEQLILSIFENQEESGKIPHVVTPTFHSKISQPPIIAWGALKVFEKSNNLEFLREVFQKNNLLLSWFHKNRRLNDKALYSWKVIIESEHCKGDESGMDNSPRFDNVKHMYAIDLTCFIAKDVYSMAKIADLLGENSKPYYDWYEAIKRDVNQYLFYDNFYYDYDIDKQAISPVKSMCGFLPLYAGICEDKHINALTKELTNPETFYTDFPIPSVALTEPSFSTDMWRGPVWLNYNYFILDGLLTSNQPDLFKKLANKMLFCINRWYEQFGTLYEFYDSKDRKCPSRLTRKGDVIEPYIFKIKPQVIRDYGWSVTTTLDLIAQLSAE